MENYGSASPPGRKFVFPALFGLRLISARKTAILFFALGALGLTPPVQGAIIYAQPPTEPGQAKTVNSNKLASSEGSDQDVIAFDNFSIARESEVTGISWRGSGGSTSFTITIYKALDNPAAEPDRSPSGMVATLSAKNNFKRTPAENGLFDYRIDLVGAGGAAKPFALSAGQSYWISIVADKKDLSVWGWANGTGGDGKTLLYFPYQRMATPSDRAFSLEGMPTHPFR
jgi:hypothetical protein